MRTAALNSLSEGILDNCELPHWSAPKQATSSCPEGPLSQKQPFTFCAAVHPGPRRRLVIPFSNSANISPHTHTLVTNRSIQAANSNKFRLDPACLWWSGKRKQGLSSGHAHPALHLAGGVKGSILGTQAMPLPVVPGTGQP